MTNGIGRMKFTSTLSTVNTTVFCSSPPRRVVYSARPSTSPTMPPTPMAMATM